MISLANFVIPLLLSKMIVQDPGVVFYTSKVLNDDYNDKIIVPIVYNNYGPYIRSIYKMQATLFCDNEALTFLPYYEYESIVENGKLEGFFKLFKPLISQ
jgi:hypothetical protein